MKIEVGQIWRLKGKDSTYYIYKVERWTNNWDGKHTAGLLELIGPPDPDYYPEWKEHEDVMNEWYDLITDEEELGILHLQRLDNV